jgi:hypothetical protein
MYPTKYMGWDQEWDVPGGFMFLGCPTRIHRLIKEEQWQDLPEFDNPVSPNIFREEEDSPLIDSARYMKVVFLLLWMSLMAGRLDIALPVNVLTQRAKSPTEADWKMVLRVVGYLKRNPNRCLALGQSDYEGDDDDMTLGAMTDASHAVYPEGHSHGGFFILLGPIIIFWVSFKSKVLSRASMGSEVQYHLAAADKIEFLRQVFISVDLAVTLPMVVYTDSDSAILTMRRTKLSSKMIHEIVRNNYLRQLIDKGILVLQHVRTEILGADLLTKYLPTKQFEFLLSGLMVDRMADTMAKYLAAEEFAELLDQLLCESRP